MSSASIRGQIADRFAPVLVSDEPGWIGAEDLLSQRHRTQMNVMLEAQRCSRTPTERSAGSLLLLEYTRLLAWPVLAARLLDGTALDPTPSNVALRPGGLERGRLGFRRVPTASPTQLGRSLDVGAPAGPDELLDAVAGAVDHLRQLAEVIGQRVRIGRRTLLGDIASALVGGFLALSWMGHPRDRYLELAARAIESQPDLRALVSLTTIHHEGQPWMVAWRRVCCLAFGDNSSPNYCGTCPILDDYERIERFHHTASRYLRLTSGSPRHP